ncbi:MAG: hypothetical protein JNM93_08565 [Bacteriovoracaceae bacterium]|nr:hypothetical protein [Bacteriovoracaceae bacterium]
MKKLIIFLLATQLFSCHHDKYETNAARKAAKHSLGRLKDEVRSLRSWTLNRSKKLSLETMLILITGPLTSGLNDLKKPKNESIAKAILSALRFELDYLKQEVALSPVKKHNLINIQNEIKILDNLLEQAYSRLEKNNYRYTELNQAWMDWIMLGIKQETPKTRIYSQIKPELIEEVERESSMKQKKYIEQIYRLVAMRDNYFNNLTTLVGQEAISDETWPRLKYSAIRSVLFGELLAEKMSSSPMAFINPVLIDQVENDDGDKNCKLKSSIPVATGDEAGTMNGSVTATPKGDSPAIKCKLSVEVVPPPVPVVK